jgi:hypothetical protein
MLKTICDDLTTCCGETPVLDFTELGDVPHSYVGAAGEVVRVNATEDGLEFFTLTLVTSFLGLSDTPNTYAGSALEFVRVNAGANALEFFDLTATLVTTFLQLTDTPSSYSGAALKYVRVNAGATALEFFDLTSTLVTTFLQLTDTPASYSGAGLKIVRVNAGATALEFHSEAFVDLADVPSSYSGAVAGQFVVVNSTANGLEFLGGTGPTSPTAIQLGKTRSAIFPTAGGTMVIGPTQSNDAAGGITNVMSSATILGSQYRSTLKSAAGAGSSSGCRVPQLMVSRGSATGCGGFRFAARWGTSTSVAQQRSFVGVINQTVQIANVNPSTLLDLFGVSYNSAGGQLLLTYNDGSGAATQDAIGGGTGYPVDSTTVYELVFSCAPDATTIEYIIRNISTGASETGQKTTNLPTNTLFLAPFQWVNNGTTATAVQIDLIYMTLELY